MIYVCKKCHTPLPPKKDGTPRKAAEYCTACNALRWEKRKDATNANRCRKQRIAPEDIAYCFVDGESYDGILYSYFAVIVTYHNETLTFDINTPGKRIGLMQAIQLLYKVDFIMKHTYHAPKRLFHSFSFNYDKQMLLYGLQQDLEAEPNADMQAIRNALYTLSRQENRTFGAKRTADWKRDFRLYHEQQAYDIYLGKKTWEFHKVKNTKPDEEEVYWRLQVHDTFTLKTQSFLKAVVMPIQAHPDYASDPLLQTICQQVITGKSARSNFAASNLSYDDMIAYNRSEGILANLYMLHFYQMCRRIDIYPNNPAGPTPLTRAAIKKHGVKSHIKPDWWDDLEFHTPTGIYKKISYSYKAGRIESFGQRHVPELHEYDIHSAYPAQQIHLPCLAHGHFEELDEDAAHDAFERREPYIIYNIDFTCDRSEEIGPFSVRAEDGHICYPQVGKNVWTGPQSLYAFADMAEDNNNANIISAVQWIPECTECEHPFSFLADYYEARRQLKEEHDASELILKLIINSAYGLLAQVAGSYEVIDPETQSVLEIHTPPYANLFGATLVTDGCRAQVYRAAKQAPKGTLLMISTDAVKTSVPLPFLEEGPLLGQWEHEIYHDVLICQTGFTLDKAGKAFKTRGMSPATFLGTVTPDIIEKVSQTYPEVLSQHPEQLNDLAYKWLYQKRYEEILECWRTGKPSFTVTDNTFYGYKQCLHLYGGEAHWTHPEQLCTFVTVTREVDISPNALSSKRAVKAQRNGTSFYRTLPVRRVDERPIERELTQLQRTILQEEAGNYG